MTKNSAAAKSPSKTTIAYLEYLANAKSSTNPEGLNRPRCSYGTQERIIAQAGWAVEVRNANGTRSLKLTEAGLAFIA